MTRITSFKRPVAALVALCILCVSCFTIPVHAIGEEIVMIPALQAMVSQLMGLGLEANGGNDALTTFAQTLVELPEMSKYIVQNGGQYFVNAVKKNGLLYLPLEMIGITRARLYGKGDFSSTLPIIVEHNFSTWTGNFNVSFYSPANQKSYTFTSLPYNYSSYTGSYTLVGVVTGKVDENTSHMSYQVYVYACNYDSNWGSINSSGIKCQYVTQLNTNPLQTTPNISFVTYNGTYPYEDSITSISSSTSVSPDYSSNYNLGVTAPYDTSISDGYTTWASGAIDVPNTETGTDDKYFPVGVGSTLEGTLGKTQEEIWSGVTDISTETTDVATNVQSMKGTLTQVLSSVNSIADVFTTTQAIALPSTALHFDQLFTLFPFSIPKDLVDCIGFWNAGAAAPTISIPLPKVAGGFSIQKYDIPFEDIPTAAAIVAILRAGQIILFCVGLLLITRKVTKW